MVAGNARSSSGQLWLIARPGELRRDRVAQVALAVRAPRLYSYAVPESLVALLRPGVAVRVPYGRSGRLVPGWCVRVDRTTWDQTLKPIAEVQRAEPLLNQALIELGLWLGDYYACPPGLTLAAMVPKALRQPAPRAVTYVRPTGAAPARTLTAKQRKLVDLAQAAEVRRDELLARASVGPAVLRRLCKQGVLELVAREEPAVEPDADAHDRPTSLGARSTPAPEDAFELTDGQRGALQAVRAATAAGDFRVFLLFGVPGSGKTEVYVRAIRAVVRNGRQAVLLLPEIALTTQIAERLARRFERVVVMHGLLAPRLRARNLRAIAAGKVDVVIGARSAVFAPCPRLGLIVVDEEQETSFKNLRAPFFHARDVAVKRGQIERVPVLLGSATPSLESWHNAQVSPHYRLLRMPERVPGARPPRVRLVATTGRELGQTTDLLSPELVAHLKATLADGQQAILLHNRRGYAVHLRCARCGLAVRCPRCAAPMVYHRAPDSTLAKCHRCGTRMAAPRRCLDDTCDGRLECTGLAIQRLQEELQRLFPQARLLRLDSDTMRRREDYVQALRRFEAHEADILLGTQMVAKGLDFPGVRLVGVVDADAALWLPDFRAAEHVFQLLVQVVGRAGRRAGESLALVQSGDVTVPAVRHAVRMDYESFAATELAHRQRAFQPPFARMARCVCADERPGRARDEARRLSEHLGTLAGHVQADIRVDDAEPCVITRLRDMFRYQVVVRAPRDASLQRLLRQAADEKLLAPRVRRFTIDVDPFDVL